MCYVFVYFSLFVCLCRPLSSRTSCIPSSTSLFLCAVRDATHIASPSLFSSPPQRRTTSDYDTLPGSDWGWMPEHILLSKEAPQTLIVKSRFFVKQGRGTPNNTAQRLMTGEICCVVRLGVEQKWKPRKKAQSEMPTVQQKREGKKEETKWKRRKKKKKWHNDSQHRRKQWHAPMDKREQVVFTWRAAAY